MTWILNVLGIKYFRFATFKQNVPYGTRTIKGVHFNKKNYQPTSYTLNRYRLQIVMKRVYLEKLDA
jgi:hypothetical protein